MDRVSNSCLIAVGIILAACAAKAQEPDMVLGTSGNQYHLFTPKEVVDAGGGAGGGGAPLSNDTPKVASGTGAPGTGDEASRDDHVHPAQAVPSPSTATPIIAGTGAAGSATAWSRGDHVHPAQAVPDPATQAPLVEGTAQVGTSTLYARQDHRHPSGGTGPGRGVTAYKFFALEDLTVPPITSSTQIMAGTPRTWTALAPKTYSTGLIVGPFISSYEGAVSVTLTNGGTLKLTLSVKHTFPSINKSLTSTRSMTQRLPGGVPVTFDINAVSSTTLLATGNVTADDGSTINITTDLLADPVQIGIEMGIEAIGSNERVTALTGVDTRAAFWQLEATAPASTFIGLTDTPSAFTGQSGKFVAVNSGANALSFVNAPSGGASLSDATPHGLGPGVPASAGAGTKSSRDDHVHAVAGIPGPATAKPIVEGTAAVGTSPLYARQDHVHPAAASGIPPLTGNAKSVLSVNAEADGTEWVSSTTVILEGAGIGPTEADHLIAANDAGNGIVTHTAATVVKNGLPSLTGKAGFPLVANTQADGYAFLSPGTLVGSGLPATNFTGGNILVAGTRPASAWQTPHATVLSGLPGLSGHAGNVLTVNAGQTGVEWTAKGGGSSGAGALEWDDLLSRTNPACASNTAFASVIYINMTDSEATAVKTALLSSPLVRIWGVTNARNRTPYQFILPSAVSAIGATDFAEFHAWEQDWRVASATSQFSGEGKAWLEFEPPDSSAVPPKARVQRIAIRDFDTVALCNFKTLKVQRLTGGGGGGSSGPTIPNPTAAGALKHLRVNAAGAAYELADPPIGIPSPTNAETGQVLTRNNSGNAQWLDNAGAPFGTGWVKLFEGSQNNIAGSTALDINLTSTTTEAEGFLEAQRDTAGSGPYRQFLWQMAWNIGEGADEELVQVQAQLVGVPLGGSVAQANQPVAYWGAMSSLNSLCNVALKASRTVVNFSTSSCRPDWGNRGSAGNVSLFWKLWGRR